MKRKRYLRQEALAGVNKNSQANLTISQLNVLIARGGAGAEVLMFKLASKPSG